MISKRGPQTRPKLKSLSIVLLAGIFISNTFFPHHLSAGNQTLNRIIGTEVDTANHMEDLDGSTIMINFNRLPDENKDMIVSMWTMTSKPHQEFAKKAVKKINDNEVAGAIVECGVWMGGMTMGMVFENMKQNITRHFWLFDTFEGLPEPSDEKDDPRAKKIYADLQEGKQTDKIVNSHKSRGMMDGKWNYGPLDLVKNNLRFTGYPQENFHFIKGKVEDTLPVTKLPDKIAILRLDTDWYLSTKMELEYMFDRLQSGGVLIIDDFCTWGGSRTATTEYFKEKLNLDANSISKTSPCLVYWKP